MSGGDFCGGGFTILGTKEECKEVLRLLSYYSHEKYEQWEQGHTVHGWYLMGYEDCRSIFSDEFANDPISPEELLQGMYHDGGMEIYLFGPYTCGLSGAHDFDFFEQIAQVAPNAYLDGKIYDDDCVKYALLKDGILRIRYRWGDDPVIEDPKDEDWEEAYDPINKKRIK